MSPDGHDTPTERRYGRRATDGPPIPLDPELVQVMDIRRKARRGHIMRLVGYGVLCLAVFLGFVRMEMQQYEACEQGNDLRTSLRVFLDRAYQADEDGITPGEQAVLDLAEENIGDVDCPPVPLIFWD